MLTSGVEPANLPFLPNPGAGALLAGCRHWQSAALGASSGSAVFDSCSLGAVSITEQQPLSSYVTDDYFLAFADMCGDGEIITQINAAPANGGWAGLEVREDTVSSARKFGLRTQTGTIAQPFIRPTAGQAMTLLSFVKPPHQWLKVSRSGDYFTAYTSSDGSFWVFAYAATLALPECVKAGVYAQSLYVGAPATALFNQVTITDNSPATTVNFADSTLTAAPGDSIQICVGISNPCACSPVSVDVALTSSGSPHLPGFTTQNLAFTPGSTQQCFSIVLADTAVAASYTFSLQNVSGGNNGQVGSVGQLDLAVNSSTDLFCGAATAPPADSTSISVAVDRFGNAYSLSQMAVPQSTGSGSTQQMRGYDGCDCDDLGIDTDYFDIWFQDCIFDTQSGFAASADGEDRRRVVCEVFQEIAAMIQPGGGGCGGEQAVNIQIVPSQGNTPVTTQELPDEYGGVGSPYYFFQPTGISDGLPWMIINTGETPEEFRDMFHGTIRMNFHSPQFDWHLGLNGNPPAADQHDLHSVVWHEALHVLGFASTFYENPERTRFDRFLTLVYQDGTETPVIENVNPPGFAWDVSAGITDNDLFSSCLDPSPGGPVEPDMVFQSPNGNYPIFTGDQFIFATSFSHLEIDCDNNPTPEYLMSPGLPSGTRRPITGEEIEILCALGYVMAPGGGPACGCRVAGAEDFGPNCGSLYRISLCADSLIIPIADLIANDGPNVVDIGHVGMLDPLLGSIERVGNNLIFRPGRIGLAVFAYVPVGCNGLEGNTTKVFVNVVADPDCPLTYECEELLKCDSITAFPRCQEDLNCGTENNSCNLICNPGVCGTIYGRLNPQFGTFHFYQFDRRNNAHAPGWHRTHGTPDIINFLPPPDFYIQLGAIGSAFPNQPSNSEGIMTPIELELNNNYIVGFDFRASTAPFVSDSAFLALDLIDSRELLYSPSYNDPIDYSGSIMNILQLTGTSTGSFVKQGAGCISVTDSSLNALWIHADTEANSANATFSIDNLELIEDTFTAGPDTTLAHCGDEARLGGRFCMLSDVEITYTWEVAGQVIGEYTVVNDSIAITTGNIDTSTHQLVITPGTTAEYVLRRTISDFGGLPNDFALCAETDTVTVTVLQAPPSPGFTFVVNEDSCQVQFTSLDTTGTHLWDFGDAGSSSAINPLYTYSGSGPFSVVHTVSNECGAFEADQIVDISCCAAPDAAFAVTIDTCTRTASFAAAPGQEANYHRWEFGDAANSTADGVGLTAASFTYPAPGTYTAGHAVDELACGESDFEAITFAIPALPPLGDPTQAFATPLECGEVEFQLRDSLGGTLFFGDGASVVADTAYIYHDYAVPADYTATYILSNGCEQDSFSFAVPLAQYAPQAAAQLDDVFCLGIVVSAGDTTAGHSYQWQFGPSGAVAGAQAAYTFDSAGLYDVILTVSDTCGNSAADTLQVAVEDCVEALSCPCADGVNIVADSVNGTRLSTLTALGILPPGLLANTCLAVSGLLLVDEDYDISGGEVYMHPGSEIGVGLGSEQVTFAISAMWQSPGVQGCGQMWKGIRVDDDSRLVLKGARIADAQYAIHALNKSTILVNESFFNRNYISLYFDAPGSGTFALEAFLGTEVLGYEALLGPYAGQSPAPGARPYAGISLRHGREVAPKRIGGLGAGSSPPNRFEGLRNGILTEGTPLVVHNSAFADIETASSEPYPFTGFGIRHIGGAAHPLLQRGLGNTYASDPSFKNCARAIWAEGTAVDVADNYMAACGYGVQVQLAQGRQVSVNGNLMEVDRTGINLLNNAPLPILEVDGNDIATTSRGINVEETGIAFADAAIRSNTVTLAGRGFGLRLTGVNGLEASDNDIFMEQAVLSPSGIRVNGAINCTIRENYVAGPGPTSLFFVGLGVQDGGSSVFDCNTFTELGTGAAFEGSCMGSTVSTNVFEPGTLGMGRGLVYRNSLVIGQQSHEGNLWEINTGLPNEGYEGAAAVNFDDDLVLLSLNRYIVNDDTPPVYPSSFDFPNFTPALQQAAESAWFLVDEGISDTCIQNGGLELPEVKDIHVKTARSEQLDEDYPGAMLWAAQLQLYRELDVEEWPADEVLDSFYLANETTLLSAFYQLEKGRDSLYKLSPAETVQLQQWGEALDGLIGFILEKDSLIAAGANGQENARDSLLNEAASLCIAIDSLEQVIRQARVSFAGTLLTANSALSDTAVYQTNEKLSSKLFLNTIAQGSSAFDAQQTESLLSVAGQCPLSGGRTVHYARSLYQLVADSTFADVCEVGSQRVASLPVFSEEISENIRIFPNPTSGELMIKGYCDRIDIVNQLGQPILTRNLSEGEFQHLVNLQGLPGSIYFLRAWLKNEPISQVKLIISK